MLFNEVDTKLKGNLFKKSLFPTFVNVKQISV